MPRTTVESLNQTLRGGYGSDFPELSHVAVRRETDTTGFETSSGFGRTIPTGHRTFIDFTMRNPRPRDLDPVLLQRCAAAVAQYVPVVAGMIRAGYTVRIQRINQSMSEPDVTVVCELVPDHARMDADLRRNADAARERIRARAARLRHEQAIAANPPAPEPEPELTLREILERSGVDRNIYERR